MSDRNKTTSLRDVVDQFEFCVVDLETTGLRPEYGAEIIEMGGVRIENGVLTETFEQLIEPASSIPPKITEITGISNEMVRGKPPLEDVLPEFVHFLGDAILIAHNFSFDFSFLDWYHNDHFFNENICTVRMARAVGNFRSNSLDHLVRRLDLGRERAHRALDDAVATGKLFRILTEKVTSPEDYHRAGIPEALRQYDPGALAMEISGIGKSKANNISEAVSTVRELLDASEEELQEIQGIGPGHAKSIRSYLDNYTTASPVRKKPLKQDR